MAMGASRRAAQTDRPRRRPAKEARWRQKSDGRQLPQQNACNRTALVLLARPVEDVMNTHRKLDCSMPASVAYRGERIALRAWRDFGG